jgi:hypothetical protein
VAGALAVTIANVRIVDAIGSNNWSDAQADALGPARPDFISGHDLADRASPALSVAAIALAAWLGWRNAIRRGIAGVAVLVNVAGGLGVFVLAAGAVVRRIGRVSHRTTGGRGQTLQHLTTDDSVDHSDLAVACPVAILEKAPGLRGMRSVVGLGNVDDDAHLVGDLSEPIADVTARAEPQLAAVDQAGGEGLPDEQPSRSICSSDRCGLVEQRTRIEDLEDLGMRPLDCLPVNVAQQLGELSSAGNVDWSEEPVVTVGRQRQGLVDHEQRSAVRAFRHLRCCSPRAPRHLRGRCRAQIGTPPCGRP